jgi:hypothetical protein
MYSIRFLILLFFGLSFFVNKSSFADVYDNQNSYRCNTNDNCQSGYWCDGGTAANGDQNYTGFCRKSIVLSVACQFKNVIVNKFGRLLTVLVLLFLGYEVVVTKDSSPINSKRMFTLMLCVVFIFASGAVVSLIISDDRDPCLVK